MPLNKRPKMSELAQNGCDRHKLRDIMHAESKMPNFPLFSLYGYAKTIKSLDKRDDIDIVLIHCIYLFGVN